MLQLTDKAAARLKSALTELDLDEGACFRLRMTEEGVKMVVDHEHPDDSTIEHDGKVLVVIDAESAGRFEGRKMDFNEETERMTFILTE
jgi:Fe-S cluster assembly iron-binding protein IscA